VLTSTPLFAVAVVVVVVVAVRRAIDMQISDVLIIRLWPLDSSEAEAKADKLQSNGGSSFQGVIKRKHRIFGSLCGPFFCTSINNVGPSIQLLLFWEQFIVQFYG